MQHACLAFSVLSPLVGMVWQKNKLHPFSSCDVNGWVHFGPWGQVSKAIKLSFFLKAWTMKAYQFIPWICSCDNIFHCGYCWVVVIQSGPNCAAIILSTAGMWCSLCILSTNKAFFLFEMNTHGTTSRTTSSNFALSQNGKSFCIHFINNITSKILLKTMYIRFKICNAKTAEPWNVLITRALISELKSL